MPCGGQDGTAIGEAKPAVHPYPEPFEHCSEVPWVDAVAIDSGLAANRVEAGPVEKGGPQGVVNYRFIEPGDRSRRCGEHGFRRRPAFE